MKSVLLAAVLVALAGSALYVTRVKSLAAASTSANHAAAQSSFGQSSFGQSSLGHSSRPAKSFALPLYFEPNQGQTDPRVKYLARGAGYGLFLTADEAVLDLERPAAKGQPTAGSVIRMRLEGANAAARVTGEQPLPGKSSYFIGNEPSKWRTGIPQFASVQYQDVYPGINLVYYGKESDRQLEYDFRVAPGAEPSRIALAIEGADTHLDSGDLVLATANGEVRFHAPRVYQTVGKKQSDVAGSFRLLGENKVGFTVGPYDHSRELVIDPELLYSSYLGNGVVQPTQVAVDNTGNIYLAGSTTSSSFPVTSGAFQSMLASGATQNIFITVLEPGLAAGGTSTELIYSTYLGGSGTDTLAGLTVQTAFDSGTTGFDIYVAGTTTSSNFPTAGVQTAFQASPVTAGAHGFLTRLNYQAGSSQLRYSTYLSGNGTDTVTGLASDQNANAYVTGTTTSTNDQSNNFPANSVGFQTCPFAPPQQPGGCVVTGSVAQFFASKLATSQGGTASMIYSTYFGGSNGTTATGGGIAVDGSGNMYFTGTTNIASVTSAGGATPFPIFNATQPCLNQPGATSCSNPPTNTDTDAILVKIAPNSSAKPFYATYLGGSSNDTGTAIALDGEDNAYATGSTTSGDWSCTVPCTQAPSPPFGFVSADANNAFIAQVTNENATSAIYPLNYLAYLGGSSSDSSSDTVIGQAIVVDSQGSVHLVGSTSSPNLPIGFAFTTGQTTNYLQSYQGGGDAFVALISPPFADTTGDWITYLGGSQLDQGTGIAIDTSGNTYVAGTTLSPPATACTPLLNCTNPITGFPMTTTGYQQSLSGSTPNAFVTELGSNSSITVAVAPNSPNPPMTQGVDAGTQVTFLYNITNNGPDPATNVVFNVQLSNVTNYTTTPIAKLDQGIGVCAGLPPLGNTLSCTINNLAAGGMAQVEVDVTPPAPPPNPPSVTISCTYSVNGGLTTGSNCPGQSENIVDFMITPSPASQANQTILAGQLVTFQVQLAPLPNSTYNGTITMSQSPSRPLVTNPTPTFNNPTVTLDGTQSELTTLSIQTVARPITTGSLFHTRLFYAVWLPMGGLSLCGLGFGVARRRRRWVAYALFGLLASLLLLLPACSSNSSNVTPNQGTAAGQYLITITGSAGTNASHDTVVTLTVQ